MRSTWVLSMAVAARLLPDGRLTEVAPARCPAGHRLEPATVLVGWVPCDCHGMPDRGPAGHRTYLCTTVLPDDTPCGREIYRPPCSRASRSG